MAHKYISQNRKHLITESVFNNTKLFRVSTLAAMFRKPVSVVSTALNQVLADNPDHKVELEEGDRGRAARVVGRRTMNQLMKQLNVTSLFFRREKGEKTEKAPRAPRKTAFTEGRVTEAQFNEQTWFRIKTASATLNRNPVMVTVALRELRIANPNLQVRFVETGTKGRPPIEISRDVLIQLGEKLNAQALHFADHAPTATPSTETVVDQAAV